MGYIFNTPPVWWAFFNSDILDVSMVPLPCRTGVTGAFQPSLVEPSTIGGKLILHLPGLQLPGPWKFSRYTTFFGEQAIIFTKRVGLKTLGKFGRTRRFFSMIFKSALTDFCHINNQHFSAFFSSAFRFMYCISTSVLVVASFWQIRTSHAMLLPLGSAESVILENLGLAHLRS